MTRRIETQNVVVLQGPIFSQFDKGLALDNDLEQKPFPRNQLCERRNAVNLCPNENDEKRKDKKKKKEEKTQTLKSERANEESFISEKETEKMTPSSFSFGIETRKRYLQIMICQMYNHSLGASNQVCFFWLNFLSLHYFFCCSTGGAVLGGASIGGGGGDGEYGGGGGRFPEGRESEKAGGK